MKKILLTLAFILCLALPVSALDLGLFDANVPSLNLNGDLLYFPRTGETGYGVGTKLLDIEDGHGELRLEAAAPFNQPDKMKYAGLGAGIDPVKVTVAGFNALGVNTRWVTDKVRVNLGVMYMADITSLSTKLRFEPAFYLTIIGTL